MIKTVTNLPSMQLLSQNKLECLFLGLFFSTGIVITILTLLELLSSTLWLLFGGSLVVLALISVYLTQKSTVSLYIIIFFQFFIRLPFLLRDFYFLYEIDEMYHFGLARFVAFFQNEFPIGKLGTINVYPLMDTITAQVLKVFGITITMVLIKLFYGIIIPIVVVIFIDSVYKQLGKEHSFRIATLIFSSCYRFLFFFSLYIFETGTILLFVALLWVICSISAMKKFNILFYVFSLLLLIGFFLLGMWHYNGVFMGNIMLFAYYALMRVETKIQSGKWETRFDFCFMIYFLMLNWYVLSNPLAGKLNTSLYFMILKAITPFFNSFPDNLGLLIVLEIFLIVFLVVSFIILSKTIVLVQQTISLCLEWLEKIGRKNFNKIFLVSTIIIEIMLFIVSVSFYTYYGSSEGFRTIGDFGFFTVLTLDGLIHFFILAIFSIRWILNEKQRVFYFLFIFFLIIFLVTFIRRPLSISTFPYRLIIYVFLFGTPLATISLKQGLEFIIRSFPISNFRINRTIFNKSLKLEHIFRTCFLFLILLIMSQAVTLARWEGYTSAAYSLPREDIFYMSAWMRVNLDQKDKVFVEFIYLSISHYSLIDRAVSDEIQILLSLYYQRNISRVIELFWSSGITYLIFDLASIHPRFMTNIYRDHILTSYGVPSSSLQNFNGTQPNEFEIIFRTKHLALLKVPPRP